jgi:hypothetical protein
LCAFLIITFVRTASAATTTIWGDTSTPADLSDPDNASVELGVKFRSSANGYVTGVRFYKSTSNTGVHTGSLWDKTGKQLATVTFANETASGWQTATFSSPVAITANTTYVVSYHAPNGHYSADAGYFATKSATNGPLTALQNGTDGSNGVYNYGNTPTFPTDSYNATNYWVDAIFSDTNTPPADTTAPSAISSTPATGATNVSTSVAPKVVFSEPLASASVSSSSVELRKTDNTLVNGTVSYASATNSIVFTPSAPLASATSYTLTIKGGTTDPRVKDVAGNALAANYSVSFTTGSAVAQTSSLWYPATQTTTATSDDQKSNSVPVSAAAKQVTSTRSHFTKRQEILTQPIPLRYGTILAPQSPPRHQPTKLPAAGNWLICRHLSPLLPAPHTPPATPHRTAITLLPQAT